jgi:1L-myo-inositol 1-phosphate cytidylyltransferase
MIRSAVILAAGRGSRLGGVTSKPLVEVGGVSLIGRVLGGLRQAGIEEVVVVLGYQAESLRQSVASGLGRHLRIRYVFNPDWDRSNGLSLLTAAALVQEPFILLMADHLFDPAIVETVMASRFDRFAGILAVDRLHQQVFDLPDATKVLLVEDHIERIGKGLSYYNAIDTGVFALQPRIFTELRLAAERNGGDCSLSDGVERLCQGGLMGWLDVSGHAWLDVDTPEAHAHAEDLVGANLGLSLLELQPDTTEA